MEGHWAQDFNKTSRPGSQDFSVGDRPPSAAALQPVNRRGERIPPSESQNSDSLALFTVYSLTGETRTKSTLPFPPSLFTSLLGERRCTVELMWKGES